MIEERRFSSAEDAVAHILALAEETLSDAIERYGGATLVLSGGNSPKAYLPDLARLPLDWSKVHMVPSDERWVPTSDEDSNQRLLREAFLDRGATGVRYISLKAGTERPAEALEEVAERLRSAPWPPSLAILGMGTDGHIASLFPNDETLTNSSMLVVASEMPPAQHPRISLGPRAFSETRAVVLFLPGEAKARAWQSAKISGNETDFPVCLLFKRSGHSDTAVFCPTS